MNLPFIQYQRRLFQSELWIGEKFSRGQAWVDLIYLANWKDGHIRVRGNLLKVKRGQVGWSIVKLADRWMWSRGKVTRFLNELHNEHRIEQQKNSISSLITIINYNNFQPNGTADSTTNVTADGQQTEQQTGSRRVTIERRNKEEIKKEKNITSKEVTAKAESYGNQEINLALSLLRKEVQIDDFKESQKQQRMYGMHMVNLAKKIGKEEFRLRLSGLLQDSFHSKNCNSIRYLYQNIKAFKAPTLESNVARI